MQVSKYRLDVESAVYDMRSPASGRKKPGTFPGNDISLLIIRATTHTSFESRLRACQVIDMTSGVLFATYVAAARVERVGCSTQPSNVTEVVVEGRGDAGKPSLEKITES